MNKYSNVAIEIYRYTLARLCIDVSVYLRVNLSTYLFIFVTVHVLTLYEQDYETGNYVSLYLYIDTRIHLLGYANNLFIYQIFVYLRIHF